jgi:methyltransferase (TIGR00027 family)
VSADPNRAEPAAQRLNLDNQRKRARSLLKAVRARDAQALQRFAAADSRFRRPPEDPSKWLLHHAQLVIAREQGFASWAKLKAHIVASTHPLLSGALVAAANRALETECPEPLFRDPLARALAGEEGMALHATLRTTTWPPNAAGPDPEHSIFTRYFDDALVRAVRAFSIDQVVLLGAELDARAFRLDWPDGVVVFEVERKAVVERKEAVLRELRAQPGCERRVVRSTLRGSWRRALLAAGFAADRPSAILISGELVCLDLAEVARFFRELRQIACAGSWVGLLLVGIDTIDSPFMKPFLEKRAELGWPPWRFGVRDPEAFLSEHGWDAKCDVAGAPEVSYGRWRYGYIPRTYPDRAIPRVYLAQATMSGRADERAR